MRILHFRTNSPLLLEPPGGTSLTLGPGASYTLIGASLSIHPSPFTITIHPITLHYYCSPITIYHSLSPFIIYPLPLHPLPFALPTSPTFCFFIVYVANESKVYVTVCSCLDMKLQKTGGNVSSSFISCMYPSTRPFSLFLSASLGLVSCPDPFFPKGVWARD